jgi:hypothetical protein
MVIDTVRAPLMADPRPDPQPDLLDQIPDPATVRDWLAESVRRSDLLRSLLRLAKRKAAYERTAEHPPEEDAPCRG